MTDTDCIDVLIKLVGGRNLNLTMSFIGLTICVYLCQLHIWIFRKEDPLFKDNWLKLQTPEH